MSRSLKLLSLLLLISVFCLNGIRLYYKAEILDKGIILKRARDLITKTMDKSSLQEVDARQKDMLRFMDIQRPRFYNELNDEEVIALGLELSDTVRSTGNGIKSYNILSKNGNVSYQYQLESEIEDLLQLVHVITGFHKYMTIENLNIHASESKTTASMVISPSLLRSTEEEKDSGNLLDDKIVTYIETFQQAETTAYSNTIVRTFFNFPKPRIIAAKPVKPIETAAAEPERPKIEEAPYWLSYIGKSINDDHDIYYFLDKRTNKTMELEQGLEDSVYQLIDIEPDRIILNINGEPSFVYK